MHTLRSDANRNRSKNVARRARGRFHPRNARVPLLTPLEMLERRISFQDLESLQLVDEMPQNIFNRNGSKNVARRARRSFNQRSIFTEHARVPPLTPFETFEHDISFLDRYATNEGTEDTDDIDEELSEIEDSINTNVSDTWSINNGTSEDEGEDNFIDENEEASREQMLTPSPTIGLNSPSVSDENRVMHIEFTEAAAGRNRSRNVARRGRPNPFPKNALVNLTPFQRGETFNGFAKNLELEEIVGFSYDDDDEMVLCDVKWRNDGNRTRKIEASLLRRYCPGIIADFYERVIIASIRQ
ncbi:uncharacterized protein LOC114132598 isoform X3 [Aphis gossypii]|uniref:uncharacterized protein LOC114132598 isoform X3 n=1 Tax=Aphis gossypii TaxID=80765 RepID=UPI0021590BCD|nr:uncharacterized protein LOC114132598 isoform X3 [Aphis gossypii]